MEMRKMEKEYQSEEQEIRKAVKEHNLEDFIINWVPDLWGDTLVAFAKLHLVDLKYHIFSEYEDGTEPEYVIYELRFHNKENVWSELNIKNYIDRVLEVIFALYDCCEEAATIENYNIEKEYSYVRLKVEGHYHS